MRDKIIMILIRLAHLSEKFDSLVIEIDKIYDLLGDKEFLAQIDKMSEKE